MEDKQIDNLFRSKLSGHEERPSGDTWARLEKNLNERRKPVWLVWGRYAAGLAAIIGSVYLLNLYLSPNQTEGTWTTQLEDQPNVLEEAQETENFSQTEENVSREDMKPENMKPITPKETATPKRVAKGTQAKQDPDRTITDTLEDQKAEKTKEIPIEAERLNPMTKSLAFHTGEPDFNEMVLSKAPILTGKENRGKADFTVRIVSRGLGQTGEKQDLVEEIGNGIEKIGGFFTKVDKGFADLQDAKNDLFATVLTSKKERKRN